MAGKKPHAIFGTGPLATPMPPPTLGDILNVSGDETPWQKRRREKIELLFQHSGLDPRNPGPGGFWPELAHRLMFDLVPGLREAKKGGRPKNVQNPEYIDMLFDVAKRARALKRRHPGWSKAAIREEIRKQVRRERDGKHPLNGKSNKTIERVIDEALAAAARAQEFGIPPFVFPATLGVMGFGAPPPPHDALDRGAFGLAVASLGAPPSLRHSRLVRAMTIGETNSAEGVDKNTATISVLKSETDKN